MPAERAAPTRAGPGPTMSDFDPWRSAEMAADVWLAGRGTPRGIAARQQQRLQALLAHARTAVPLHRDRARALPADAGLSLWPVLHKSELMARFDDSVADPTLTRAVVSAHLADPARLGQPVLGRCLAWESSGTSGVPGLFVQDAAALAVYDALEALRRPPRAAVSAWGSWPMTPGGGLPDLDERWAFVGVTDGPFASITSVQRLRRLNPWLAARLRCHSLLQPLPTLVAALNDWAPTVLATYPTAAAMLADEAAAGRLHLPLRELLCGGETLGIAVRRHAAQALGCAVHDSYGASEFLAMAGECAHGRLHLNADWVLLEPVDGHGRPTPPGALSRGLWLTNLANHLQPLVRYALDDRIRLPEAPCACGSPLPLLEVLGRQDDPLRLADPGRDPVTLLPLALSTVLEEDAGVFDFQLQQLDGRTLALRLGVAVEDRRAAFARCTAALQAYARAQGLKGLRVRAEPGVAPQRGRSGKVRRVLALVSGGRATPPCRQPRRRAGAAQPRTQSTK